MEDEKSIPEEELGKVSGGFRIDAVYCLVREFGFDKGDASDAVDSLLDGNAEGLASRIGETGLERVKALLKLDY